MPKVNSKFGKVPLHWNFQYLEAGWDILWDSFHTQGILKVYPASWYQERGSPILMGLKIILTNLRSNDKNMKWKCCFKRSVCLIFYYQYTTVHLRQLVVMLLVLRKACLLSFEQYLPCYYWCQYYFLFFWNMDDVITTNNGNIFDFDICIMTQQKLQVVGLMRRGKQTSRVFFP